MAELANILNSTNRRETLKDYIHWRGDLPFTADGLNLMDSMVFCQLSYVDYSSVLKQNDPEGMTLSQIGKLIQKKKTYSLRNLFGGHEDFFHDVCRSRRFKSVLVRNYSDVFEVEQEVQFGAVEFVLSRNESYVAFRGTDNTIVGWKEDFMISFTRIHAQDLAREYLKGIMKKGCSYYVGGHSKGGNLAVYSCAGLKEKQLKQIRRIYDFDGPGFCGDVFDRSHLDPLKNKVTCVIPEFCMIGKIFEVEYPDSSIVQSCNTGVDQHDLMSWLFDGMRLKTAKKNDRICEWLNRSIAEWVASATNEERKMFIDEFFGALSAGGAVTMQQVTGKGLMEVLKSMANASPASKRLTLKLAEIALTGEKKENE